MGSLARVLALCVALSLGVASLASADAADTHYEVGIDIWLSSIAGRIDTPEGATSIHVPFSELKDHLNGALAAYARGDWGSWFGRFDGLYSQLAGDDIDKTIRLGPRGGIQIPASVKSRLDEWILQLEGGHELFAFGHLFSKSAEDTRRVRGELFFGARYWAADPKIEIGLGATHVRLGDRMDWVDPFVGLRFRIDLSSTVDMEIAGDVGGFDIGGWCSKFTWAQSTELAWRFSESWVARVGYKFLDFDRSVGLNQEKMQLRGPYLDLGYRF
jgi:hypothetical protein